MGDIKPVITISDDKLAAYISLAIDETGLEKSLIYQALSAAGVVFGIDHAAVELFAQRPQVEPLLIARGTPPLPGVDERIELLFGKAEPAKATVDQIDFRETSKIVSVEAGTVLAVKHPARPGTEGKSVTGEPLNPFPPRLVKLRAGKGVEIKDEGTKAVALVDGRPWVKETAGACTVHIEPLLVLKDDVCLKSGNIKFKGSVKILGNVCEAMEVWATGDVEIMGLVTRATVCSGGNLTVHNEVINSKIKAGRHFFGAEKLSVLFKDLLTKMKNLKTGAEQLEKQKELKDVDFGRIIVTLLDDKFKDIRPLAKNAINMVAANQNFQIPEEVNKCVNSLAALIKLNFLTSEKLDEIILNLSTALETARAQAGSMSQVRIHSAAMSSIQSSGNVYVTGQGCLNTVINAGGSVVINGSFKGGEILCRGNAEIQKLGSNLGTPPLVRVGAKSHVKAKAAYPGTTIQIGLRRLTLEQEMGPLKARLNKEDELVVI